MSFAHLAKGSKFILRTDLEIMIKLSKIEQRKFRVFPNTEQNSKEVVN